MVSLAQNIKTSTSCSEFPIMTETSALTLESCRVNGTVAGSAFYVPEFVSEEEESALLRFIERSPAFKWTQLAHRRLQNYGGVPHPKGMITEEIPAWLSAVVAKVNALGVYPEHKQANHVLLNEYCPGQGILPHLDGDLFTPVICTVSLKSHTVLSFYEPIDESAAVCKTLEERLLFQLLLQPRSLLVLKEDLYEKYLHGIEEIHSDVITSFVKNADICHVKDGQELRRDTRISLTIRNVPKTSKVKIKLFK